MVQNERVLVQKVAVRKIAHEDAGKAHTPYQVPSHVVQSRQLTSHLNPLLPTDKFVLKDEVMRAIDQSHTVQIIARHQIIRYAIVSRTRHVNPEQVASEDVPIDQGMIRKVQVHTRTRGSSRERIRTNRITSNADII